MKIGTAENANKPIRIGGGCVGKIASVQLYDRAPTELEIKHMVENPSEEASELVLIQQTSEATKERVTTVEMRIDDTGDGKSIEAVAEDFYELQANVNDPETGLQSRASVTELNEVIANEEEARAESVQQLESKVNEDVGTIEQTLSTQADKVDGLEAQYTIKVDQNGVVTGFGFASTNREDEDPHSEFHVNADRFAVSSQEGGEAFFILDDNPQYDPNADPETEPEKVPEKALFLAGNAYISAQLIADTIRASQLDISDVLKAFSAEIDDLSALNATFTGTVIAKDREDNPRRRVLMQDGFIALQTSDGNAWNTQARLGVEQAEEFLPWFFASGLVDRRAAYDQVHFGTALPDSSAIVFSFDQTLSDRTGNDSFSADGGDYGDGVFKEARVGGELTSNFDIPDGDFSLAGWLHPGSNESFEFLIGTRSLLLSLSEDTLLWRRMNNTSPDQEWSINVNVSDVIFTSVAVDSDGYVYAGSDDNVVQKIHPFGSVAWSFSGHTEKVTAVAVDADGYVYSASWDDTVRKIAPDGQQVWSFSGDNEKVNAVAVDADGYVYSTTMYSEGSMIGAGYDTFLVKLSSGGDIVRWFTELAPGEVNAVAVDADGYVYIGFDNARLSKISPNENEIWSIYDFSSDEVRGVAVDADGYVYSADGNRVRKLKDFTEKTDTYTAPTDEAFHHFHLRRNGSNVELWLDGDKVASLSSVDTVNEGPLAIDLDSDSAIDDLLILTGGTIPQNEIDEYRQLGQPWTIDADVRDMRMQAMEGRNINLVTSNGGKVYINGKEVKVED